MIFTQNKVYTCRVASQMNPPLRGASLRAGIVLTCSDAQHVQWWTTMCSDERLFCIDEPWKK